MDGGHATGTEGYGYFRTLRRIIGLHSGGRESHTASRSSRRPFCSRSAFIALALAIIFVSLSLATSIQPAFSAPSTSELSVLSVSQTTIGPSSATVTYTVEAKIDGTIIPSNQVSCTPLSATTFAAVDTTVTCAFEDGSGQQINLSFKIRIDTTLPTASAPAISSNPASSAPTITSTATDSGTATSTIAAAEFFTDSIGANGAGTAMSASDGSFSSNSEALTATMTPAAFNALSPGSHTIYVHAKDGTGNWGTTASASFVKDATAPIVTNVSSTTANGAYNTGTIPITTTFSEAVTVTGIPQIQLETGATDRQATYASGSGTATLTFNYAVQAGDASTDLDYVATTSLTLNGGTIKDAAANNAVLTLPTPGGANSLGSNKGIVIDTTAPTVTSVAVNKAHIKESDVGTNAFNVTITFSEAMKNTIPPTITFIPAAGVSSAPITLTAGTGTGFNAGNTIYTAIHNIIDNNAQLAGIDVQVTNGQDAAGNVQISATPVDLFSIDTAVPAVPVINVPAASASVNSANPTISGTAEAGSMVTVKEGPTTLGTAIATGDSWSLTSSSLIDGPHTITATANDTAGNTGPASAARTFTVDTVVPTTTTPVITPNLTNAAPAITATATDPSPSTNVTHGEYFIDTVGTNGTGIAMSASDGLFNSASEGLTATMVSGTFTGLAQGTHTIHVHAKDGGGNWGTITSSTFVKDTVAPTVTASPIGGTFGASGTSVTLTSNETATIYYTTDGTTPSTASSTYSSSIPITDTTTLKFFAKDTAGNSGTVQTQTYTIDTTPPTVTPSPVGGTFNAAQTVTLTASEPSTIFYTTNGAEPTTSSSVYSTPIAISTTTTLKYLAEDTVGNLGAVQSQIYTIDTTPPTVTASPLGGTYNTAQSVTLTASEPSTIYYTTDGATPTTSSPQYSTPIAVASTTTLNFFAKDTADNSGAVQTQVYSIDSVAPTDSASPTGGLYNTPKSVTLSSSETGTTIYYTTDSTTPTSSSSTYSIPIAISTTTTLKFFGEDTAGNSGTVVTEQYTIDTVAPTANASPAGSTYGSSVSVTLDASEAGTIFFTTDGTTPTTSSPTYSSPLQVSATSTLQFFARDTAGNSGTVVTENYVVDTSVPVVTASPTGGIYNTAMAVTLTARETATIYYTTNGDTPTESSAVYSSPISVTATTTLKFFGVDATGNAGTIATEVYTIDTEAPTVTASPAGGSFTSSQSVTLSANEGGTVIYYTTNGADPDLSSPVYTSAIQLTSTTTLKFYGRDAAGNFGVIGTENYLIDTDAPTVTASPLGGSYNTAQSVTLTSSEPATIYYTTDGSTPSTSSSVYSSALLISTTTTLKFFAVDAQNNSGIVQTQVYTIDTETPTVNASPAGGVYNTAQSVTLTANEAATIYYTTNGATPTTSSPQYSTPIPISATTTLKFFGNDEAGNSGTIVTEQYTIDTTAPTVTASPIGGTFGPSGTSVTLTASEAATIYYTTNGATPTSSSSIYSSPIPISTTTTLKFFGEDTTGNSGTVQTQVYTIDNIPPIATVSPVGGTYSSIQSVTLSSSESGSTIFYTTDGSTPSTSSSVHVSTPISVNVNKVIKFFAVDSFGNTANIVTATFVLTGTSIQSSTGTGTIALSTNTGSFEAASAISESSLPTSGKPAGITFPHGFVSFVVTGIPSGSSITLTETYPTAVPPNSQYWTVIGGTWTDLTSLVGSNNGDNIITLTLADGGLGDDDGLANGRIADPSGSGTISDSTPPTVTASPTGGTYSSIQSVILSANEPGTAIYYTTNGAAPTTSSALYSGVPISITTDTTLKFFGKDPAGNNSPVSTEIYDINPAPAIVMQDTTGTTGQSLYSGRQIFAEYATPTSALVGKSIDSITIALKKSGTPPGTAQIGVINPDLSMKKVFATLTVSTLTTAYVDNEYKLPAGDVYTIQSGDRIGIKFTGSTSSSSNNISIMRDTNTADPFDGTNSHLTYYTSSWAMSGTTLNHDLKMTLKYSGGGGGGSDTTAPTVTASPVSGSYNAAQLVSLSANEPATIYYTLDGSTPTTSSSVYTGSPLSITTTTTLKFFGKDTTGNSGTVQTHVYTIDTTPPTVSASPAGGSYASVQSISLTSSESGTTIYYTTNGATPTTSSPVYSAPIQMTSTTTFKFFGKDAAGNSGSIVTELYTITIPDTTAPTVTASPIGGTFGPSGTSVTLTSNEAATIYYTTNGDTPTESSTIYSSPITISTTTTLKYFGKDTAGNPSSIQSQTYAVDSIPPTTSASPEGGAYASTQSVTLSASESGTVIRYTTNGNDPTSSSQQYSSPISISIDTTLKFYGTDSYGNAGSIVTEIYDITAPPQPPGIVMQDSTTGGTGWGIYPTRPVLSEYVSSSSVLVGKQIDSITVNIKKSESTAVGTAQIGIINSDLSMKKVFANINISTLTTSYAPKEFLLPSGDNYTIEAGDRIGIKYTGGSSSSNYIAIMRDINTSDPYDGANTYLSYYTTSWTAQTTYDLVMTLKLID